LKSTSSRYFESVSSFFVFGLSAPRLRDSLSIISFSFVSTYYFQEPSSFRAVIANDYVVSLIFLANPVKNPTYPKRISLEINLNKKEI